MRPDRRRFVTALAMAPAWAAGQSSAKVYRIGHLSTTGEAASRVLTGAFREGMRALGLVEGRHWVFEERYADGNSERLPALAQELIRARPDVLLVTGTPGTLAAKAATSTIPIVMVLVADPVGTGIVTSLARPGGNITGITNIVAELAAKRIELLKEMVPAASRIAVFVHLDNPNAAPQLRSAESAAKRLAIQLDPILPIRGRPDLEPNFESAMRANAHAAIRMIDPFAFILRKETIALAARHRLPMIYPTPEDAVDGGLIAYGTNIPNQYRQAATFVGKILRGAKPADLPVEQPTTFELVVNLKAAKALGITVPQAILVRATRLVD